MGTRRPITAWIGAGLAVCALRAVRCAAGFNIRWLLPRRAEKSHLLALFALVLYGGARGKNVVQLAPEPTPRCWITERIPLAESEVSKNEFRESDCVRRGMTLQIVKLAIACSPACRPNGPC